MGYSGIAFIGNVPTDQWIAEKLIGKPFDRTRKPPAFWTGKVLDPLLDIGQSLELLKKCFDQALTTEIRKDWRKYWEANSFDLMIAGYQWNRKGRVRPILAWLGKSTDSKTFELVWEPRDWYLGRRFNLGVIPAENVSPAHIRFVAEELSNKSIDETKDFLVRTIRQTSRNLPEVGPNCISILLLPPHIAQAHITYIPTSPALAVLANDTSAIKLKVAFSPWLIGPFSASAPSVMAGEGEIDLGFYKIYLHAPDNPRTRGIMSGQERPKPPV